MQVHILRFGILKDILGSSPSTLELDEGATVAHLLALLSGDRPSPASGREHPQETKPVRPDLLRGIAVSVNAEYATADHVLREGDEVGLLPPVSGGSPDAGDAPQAADTSTVTPNVPILTALTRDVIDSAALTAAARQGEDGAVVVFDGIVRNNSRGRQTLHLDYEAYEEMALRQINELAQQAVQTYKVRHVTLIHRLGRLTVGETSVLIVVSSAHRAQAFDACRWLIDTLKKTVPIWKKETFVDGVVWADGEPFPEGVSVAQRETSA